MTSGKKREVTALERKPIKDHSKKEYRRNRFGSMDRVSAWGLKGPGFDSSQGHVPWLRAHPQ